MIKLNVPVPRYCESKSLSLIDQPINVISDLAFFIVAFLLMKNVWNKTNHEIRVLISLVFAIGASSFLWHSFPSQLTSIPDRIAPMTLISFTLYLVTKYLSQKTSLGVVVGGIYWLSLVLLIFVLPSSAVNGSIRHGLTALSMLSLIIWIVKSRPKFLLKATSIFFLYVFAILLRIIDEPICNLVPIGTHWLWHIFSAVTAYLIVDTVDKLRIDSYPK